MKSDDAIGAAAEATAQSENPVVKTIPHAQPTAGVKSNVLPESDSPNKGRYSQTIPSKMDNKNAESDGGSKSDAPTKAKIPQHSLPTATVAGEPIVAVPQQPSSQEDSETGSGPRSGEGPNSPNSNNDITDNNGNINNEPGTNRVDPIEEPANFNPKYDFTAATNAPTNPDLAAAPAPLTTIINQYIIKGLPSSNLILIDGYTITRGQSPATISSTPIALQNDGDLIIGTSSFKNLFPTIIPSDLQNPAANITTLIPYQAPHPTHSPQIYHIRTARITADGPAITYAGTKIQALADGAVVVRDKTYFITPTPMPTPTAVGMPSAVADYSVVSEVASYNSNSSGRSGVGLESYNSTTLRGATNVVVYYGNGGNEGVCWYLLLGAITIGVATYNN